MPCIFIVIREYFDTVTHANQLFLKRILLRVLNKAFNSRVKFHIIVIFVFNFYQFLTPNQGLTAFLDVPFFLSLV